MQVLSPARSGRNDMGSSNRSNHLLRGIAYFGGVVALGSVLPDLGRFFPADISHSDAALVLVLCGMVFAFTAGQVAERILGGE